MQKFSVLELMVQVPRKLNWRRAALCNGRLWPARPIRRYDAAPSYSIEKPAVTPKGQALPGFVLVFRTDKRSCFSSARLR